MTDQSVLIPLIQMEERFDLENAMKHLEACGYKAEIRKYSRLLPSERTKSLNSKSGKFILLVEKVNYRKAMDVLETFFGFTS